MKVGNDFDPVADELQEGAARRQRRHRQEFRREDPGKIIDTYEKAVERWRPVSKEIGRDIDKFTDVLNREIFSKVDPDKL